MPPKITTETMRWVTPILVTVLLFVVGGIATNQMQIEGKITNALSAMEQRISDSIGKLERTTEKEIDEMKQRMGSIDAELTEHLKDINIHYPLKSRVDNNERVNGIQWDAIRGKRNSLNNRNGVP